MDDKRLAEIDEKMTERFSPWPGYFCQEYGCTRAYEAFRDLVEIKISNLHEENARLREALKKVSSILPPTDSKDWWCPSCKVWLPWNRVTYEECCDTCGTHLPNWPSDLQLMKVAIESALYGKKE